MALVTIVFIAVLVVMPLANAIAIVFISPLTFTLLGAFFLGEPIGSRRISAIMADFLGTLLLIQPSYNGFDAISLPPAYAAFRG